MASRHKLGATEANFENVVDPGYRPCLISAQTVKCLALGHCLGAESDEAGERGDLDYRNPPLSSFCDMPGRTCACLCALPSSAVGSGSNGCGLMSNSPLWSLEAWVWNSVFIYIRRNDQ